MRKHLVLSVVTAGLLGCVNVNAAEDLSSMFGEGKASGQIREFSISRTIDVSDNSGYTRKANAVGGYLKYETAAFKGLTLGTAFYTTNGFGLNNVETSKYTDPTLLGKNNEDYTMLGEAYLQYKFDNTTFKAGRQKLDTPLAGSDDARMLPNLFEAYVLSNKDIANTTLIAAHVTKFAQGTFGRAYGAGGILGATAGYSSWDASNQVGDFVNMGTYAINQKTDGVTAAAAIYKMNEYVSAQLWDYYAHDILNAVYGQVDLKWKCLLSDKIHPFFSAQFIKENEVGDKLLGTIDGMYAAGKFGANVENFTAYVAYSQTGKNSATDAATANAIITPWGGMPAYTQGMVTRHMFLAGTKATKVAASYNWKGFGPNLNTTVYYANYDMAQNNGYTVGDASETGFDVVYKPEAVKNLTLQFRANYADDFKVASGTLVTTSWDEYRFIANYNF